MKNYKTEFLERRLQQAIKNGDASAVRDLLHSLNRQLTEPEKDDLIQASKGATAYHLFEAVSAAGRKKELTKSLLMRYAKEGYSVGVKELEPKSEWIESVIEYFIREGQISRAEEYAKIINRKLNRDEIIACIEALVAKNDYHQTQYRLDDCLKLMGRKYLPVKYQTVVLKELKTKGDYDLFAKAGGKSKDFGRNNFTRIIKHYLEKEKYKNALELMLVGKIYTTKNFLELSKKFGRGYFSMESREVASLMKAVLQFAPKKIGSSLKSVLIGSGLHIKRLTSLGIRIDNSAIKMFVKQVGKRGKETNNEFSDGINFLENAIVCFGRAPKQDELLAFTLFLARRGDHDVVFEFAEKYKVPITRKVINALEKAQNE